MSDPIPQDEGVTVFVLGGHVHRLDFATGPLIIQNCSTTEVIVHVSTPPKPPAPTMTPKERIVLALREAVANHPETAGDFFDMLNDGLTAAEALP